MNIIIVGCGKVGRVLAEQLCAAGNNITIVDVSEEKTSVLADKFDIMAVTGNGATHATLVEAGIDNADLLIAVTDSDERNLLCCLIAKKAGNCQTIARVRSPQYSVEAPYLKNELGLAMVINPEQTAAREIERVLRFPSAIKIETFINGKLELLKFRLPEDSPLCGMAVKDISAKLHCDLLVCTVECGEEAYIANGDLVFQPRDVISIVAEPKTAFTFFRKINYKALPVRDVLIAGGGEVSQYLCELLEEDGIASTIIEKDGRRAQCLAAALPDTNVIHADAISQDVLMQEGIEKTEAFAALTNLDEENVMLSLYARSVSDAKLITKINRIDFDSVIDRLGLDTIISPKNITAECILRYVRAMKKTIGTNLETLYTIIKGKVEAAEFIIKQNSALTAAPLMELNLKPGVLVAAIFRDGKVILPRGNHQLQVGDAVVVVSNHLGLHDMIEILR